MAKGRAVFPAHNAHRRRGTAFDGRQNRVGGHRSPVSGGPSAAGRTQARRSKNAAGSRANPRPARRANRKALPTQSGWLALHFENLPHAAPAPKMRRRPRRMRLPPGNAASESRRAGWCPGIVRRQADQKGCVCILAVARKTAHAVGDYASGLTRRGHNGSARAHTERVDTAAVRHMDRELIVRRTQRRVARRGTILRRIDPFLQVFDAHADGERLWLQQHAGLKQGRKGIPRAVADREHQMGTRVFLPRTVWAAQRQSGQGAVRRKVQALYRCVEMDFPAERQNFPAQIAHDLRQVIRTDVRLCPPTGSHPAHRRAQMSRARGGYAGLLCRY